MITCIKITLTYARKRAKEGRRVNALFGEIDQSTLKHGRAHFPKKRDGRTGTQRETLGKCDSEAAS